jgi:hypothetical protein
MKEKDALLVAAGAIFLVEFAQLGILIGIFIASLD